MQKQWSQWELTFEKFLDRWEMNTDPAIAQKLLEVLKESSTVSLKDKLVFLLDLREMYTEAGPLSWPARQFRWPAVKLLFELLSERKNIPSGFVPPYPSFIFHSSRRYKEYALCDMGLTEHEYQILHERVAVHLASMIVLENLGDMPEEFREGWQHKINKFIHAILASDCKEKQNSAVWNFLLPKALINNGMYEELVKYREGNTTTITAMLSAHIFGEAWELTHYLDIASIYSKILEALKNDKHDHHAVNALERILARAGFLDPLIHKSSLKQVAP